MRQKTRTLKRSLIQFWCLHELHEAVSGCIHGNQLNPPRTEMRSRLKLRTPGAPPSRPNVTRNLLHCARVCVVSNLETKTKTEQIASDRIRSHRVATQFNDLIVWTAVDWHRVR